MKLLPPVLSALGAFAAGFFLGREATPDGPVFTFASAPAPVLAPVPAPVLAPALSAGAASPTPSASSPAAPAPEVEETAAAWQSRLSRGAGSVATIDSLALSESEAVAIETALELARADLRASERARRTLSHPSPETTVCEIAPHATALDTARAAYRERVRTALGAERGERAWASLADALEHEFPPHDQPRRIELRRLPGDQVQITEEHRLGSRRGQRTSVSSEIPENLRHLFAP